MLKAKMRETGALLGGEMSGHLFFADRYFGYDDAIYASCRLLELLSRADLSQLLADLPSSVTTPEIRLPCPDELKFALAERVCQRLRGGHDLTDIDGVRVRFAHGWGTGPGVEHPSRLWSCALRLRPRPSWTSTGPLLKGWSRRHGGS